MPIRTLITVIALFFSHSLFAQITRHSRHTDSLSHTPYLPGLRSFTQAAYISFWGPGAFAAMNYDIRFNGTNQGLGVRAGLGVAPDYSEKWYNRKGQVTGTIRRPVMLTIPFGLNYIIGTGKHFMEVGTGMTYLSDDSLCYDDITTSYTWLGWVSMNYRRTVGKHLLMRVGLTAMASKRYVAPFPTPEWGMGFRF